MLKLLNSLQNLMDAVVRGLDFLGPLALRLYLVPVFWVAGTNKLSGFDDVVACVIDDYQLYSGDPKQLAPRISALLETYKEAYPKWPDAWAYAGQVLRDQADVEYMVGESVKRLRG